MHRDYHSKRRICCRKSDISEREREWEREREREWKGAIERGSDWARKAEREIIVAAMVMLKGVTRERGLN